LHALAHASFLPLLLPATGSFSLNSSTIGNAACPNDGCPHKIFGSCVNNAFNLSELAQNLPSSELGFMWVHVLWVHAFWLWVATLICFWSWTKSPRRLKETNC
jgi:hypothetical protein